MDEVERLPVAEGSQIVNGRAVGNFFAEGGETFETEDGVIKVTDSVPVAESAVVVELAFEEAKDQVRRVTELFP
jgi:hypothetical protein